MTKNSEGIKHKYWIYQKIGAIKIPCVALSYTRSFIENSHSITPQKKGVKSCSWFLESYIITNATGGRMGRAKRCWALSRITTLFIHWTFHLNPEGKNCYGTVKQSNTNNASLASRAYLLDYRNRSTRMYGCLFMSIREYIKHLQSHGSKGTKSRHKRAGKFYASLFRVELCMQVPCSALGYSNLFLWESKHLVKNNITWALTYSITSRIPRKNTGWSNL